MMEVEESEQTELGIVPLAPVVVEYAAPPIAVCEALRRLAIASMVGPNADGAATRRLNYKWLAQDKLGEAGITYVLLSGPLRYLHCDIVPETTARGGAALTVNCAYSTINQRWKGIYERWRAHSEAVVLRDEVLRLLKVELRNQPPVSMPAGDSSPDVATL
jgi:hypothetical protein